METSPTRSTCGTRRSRAAISSYSSRIVCALVLSSVPLSGIIVAIAVSSRYCDELDSRPRRSENSANSYSHLESWRSIRSISTCRTDSIAASLQQHSRATLFDRR